MKELLKEKKYRKILKNPDLKVLYNINRKKMIKMIKSQSKTNKLKLSLKDYQNNLIRNNPKLKTEFLKRTLNKGFQYLQIQDKMAEQKVKPLIKYINYIQNKELDVINESNNFNQNLYSKFIELGFSPRKLNFKAEKIEYKDVLTNYK
jgi:thioester reductase-like protein